MVIVYGCLVWLVGVALPSSVSLVVAHLVVVPMFGLCIMVELFHIILSVGLGGWLFIAVVTAIG